MVLRRLHAPRRPRRPHATTKAPNNVAISPLFFLKGSHKYEHRLLCGAPLVLLACIGYAYYFGLVTMRWTVLETSYMFAISVTTVGYGLPTESDLDDLDSLQKWSLVGY